MKTAGFTLIEIAVVLAIVGMVLLLVIPRLPSSDRENLRISARTLAATLRYVQERATAVRTGYYINVVPGTGTIHTYEYSDIESNKEPVDPLLQKSPIKEGIEVTDVFIPRLGKVQDGQVRLDIGSGGLRDVVIIHLRAGDGQFSTVMAFPSGGKVKVYEGYQEEAL
ncbi:MAG TPA: prepilin-type N-terminal cleavage/methylation domain-containing protein [Desulfuromonadales bacterium]|nr:prepilin-type N-terminal cleavage/methylation domain-containing protein [Desulfuromonadales bacterium]